MNSYLWIVPLTGLIIMEFIADYFVGRFGENGKFIYGFIAIVFFILANIAWLYAVRNGSGIARGAVIFAVATASLAVILGVVVFHEHVSLTQWVGIIIGIASITLLSI